MKILLLALIFGMILLMAHYGNEAPRRAPKAQRLRRLPPPGQNRGN